ncbi:MAG: phosphohydrolase [Sulfurimonas sp.]|nr:MAG: phosphohydrolase [Sulfurimonas sp.]
MEYSQINNKIYSKAFLRSLFLVQNKWHQHGIFIHTLGVIYYAVLGDGMKFFAAALLHDVGKPFSAFVKDEEDEKFNEYSFTDHEERSYQIIKNWPFVSQYTKNIVRYHYLIRDIKKSKTENLARYVEKKEIWDSLDKDMQTDLERFLIHDDRGKGKKKR